MSGNANPLELAGTDLAVRTKLNAYIDYEKAKVVRQTLTTRLALFLLAVGVLSLGLHVLPTAAFLTTVLMASGIFLVAGTNERKARQRLTKHLDGRHVS